MTAPRLLTPDEAGELLRCSGETVKRYVRSGELQAFRHRGRVLIPDAAIDRFVEERLTAPARTSRTRVGRQRAHQRALGGATAGPYEAGRRLVEFG